MTGVQRHGSGGPWEDRIGYSRVVRAGAHIWVAGCTATTPDGVVLGPGDAYAQTLACLDAVERALAQVGAGLADVVRTRISVTDISRWADVGRAHREVFGHRRPATAMVQVAALMDPRHLVEVEADAFVADATGG